MTHKTMMTPIAAVALMAAGSMLYAQDDSTEAAAVPKVTHTVVMKTSMGQITLELYGTDAPKTVENFVGLCKKKFYNGIGFHRCVPGFVIQAGDPKSKDPALREQWGTGGESLYGTEFEDELNPITPSYRRGYVTGVLAMANRGPNTNSSQFFITCRELSSLPRNYTIFGMVKAGMDVVHTIEALGEGRPNNRPDVPPVIVSVTVKKGKLKNVVK